MTKVASAHGTLYPASTAAGYLGIGVASLRRLIAAKSITVVRDDRGRLKGLYTADMDVWIETHRDLAVDQEATRRAARSYAVDERMRALLPPLHERRFAGR